MSEQNNTEMAFQIQRIYTKDVSFEAPNAPHVFQKDWQPEVKLDLDCLGAYCPNILFPYARECITSLVSRGTFPQLNLAPVNFDALFMNYLQQQAGEGTEEHQDA